MGTEVTDIPPGNDHLTAPQLAAWLARHHAPPALGTVSRAAAQQAQEEHLLACDHCRMQLVMLREATITNSPDETSPEFAQLLQLGAQAGRTAHEREAAVASAAQRSTPTSLPGKPAKAGTVRWWQNLFAPRPLLASGAVATVLALALVGWWQWSKNSPLRKANEALQLAWRDRRPLEARITGMPYAPWIQTRDNHDGLTDQLAHDRAERILLEELHEHPSATAAHALGRLYLADRKFDRAIEQFETALKATPDDAQLLSDFGTVQLEKGKNNSAEADAGQRLLAFAKALEYLNKAVELQPTLREAHYNRALCLQFMYLPQQARAAWEAYLKLDAQSAWATEARRNIQQIDEQLQKTSLTRAQVYEKFLAAWQADSEADMLELILRNRDPRGVSLENRLIADLLRAWAERKAAEPFLLAFVRLGELVARQSGDRWPQTLAHYYRTANAAQRQASAAARQLVETGQQHYAQSQVEQAAQCYQQAQRCFQRANNHAEALLMQYLHAYCLIFPPQFERAEPLLRDLQRQAQVKGFRWLEQRASEALRQIRHEQTQRPAPKESNEQLLRFAQQLGDIETLSRIFNLIALDHFGLRNHRAALGWQAKGLALDQSHGLAAAQRWTLVAQTGMTCNALGLSQAALPYLQEASLIAATLQHPLYRSRSLSHLGDTYISLGQVERGLAAHTQAWELGQQVGDARASADLCGYAALRLGDVALRQGNYQAALAWYEQSSQFAEQHKLTPYLYAAQKGKLLTAYRRKDETAIAQIIPVVWRLFEQYREQIAQESQRNMFFDHEQSVAEIAIDFAYAMRQQPALAFDYAESSRARALFDLMQTAVRPSAEAAAAELTIKTTFPPLSLAQVQAALPDEVQLLQYALLNDKLIVWLVERHRVLARHSDITASAITNQIQQFLNLLKQPDSAQTTDQLRQSTAQALYRQLIEPLAQALASHKLLVVIPDKALHALPFQALIDPATGKYLIEQQTLQYAPSASVFLAATQVARARQRLSTESLLAVGNPVFPANRQLAALPAAAREVQAIAQLYQPTSRALVAQTATESAIRRALPQTTVAHFATHYLPVTEQVAASRLLLTAEPDTQRASADGQLENAEIYGLQMPQARLVVLSACQTGVEQSLAGEGALGATRPFLAIRVPQVIASLWAVDSTATANLMIKLHQLRRLPNGSTVQALRQAQLAFLQANELSLRHPYYWAGFSLFGGYASY